TTSISPPQTNTLSLHDALPILRERLIRETIIPASGNGNGAEGNGLTFQEMKSRLHRALINRMDLSKLSSLAPEQVHAEVSRLARSEEHTSELQSRGHLVCRLLL